MIPPAPPTTPFALPSPAAADPTPIVAASLEPLIDSALTLTARATLSATPTPGALFAAPPVLVELDRRYAAAGWATSLEDGKLTIERRIES